MIRIGCIVAASSLLLGCASNAAPERTPFDTLFPPEPSADGGATTAPAATPELEQLREERRKEEREALKARLREELDAALLFCAAHTGAVAAAAPVHFRFVANPDFGGLMAIRVWADGEGAPFAQCFDSLFETTIAYRLMVDYAQDGGFVEDYTMTVALAAIPDAMTPAIEATLEEDLEEAPLRED